MDKFKSYLKENRGALTRIANELGRYPSTVSQWQRVPAEHMFAVSRIIGIPPEQLRPDLFAGMTTTEEGRGTT